MTSLGAIFKLYRGHPLFLLLSGALVGVMAIIYFLWSQRVYGWIEDMMTLWLIVWMCQAFLLGLLLKRQVVSPLAGILPGYRRDVALVALAILSITGTATTAWIVSMPGWLHPDRALVVLSFLCALTYLVTVVIAYISVPILVFLSYGTLLLLVTRILDILDMVMHVRGLFEGLVGVLGLILVAFVWRMASLREGMAEYPYLLSWPLYRSVSTALSQDAAYVPAHIPAYAQRKGLAAQSLHWARIEGAAAGQSGLVFLGASGLFMGYIMFSQGHGFYAKPYGNFLFLVMVPLFITLMANYRVMAYREHALMRPVERESLTGQWGMLLALTLGAGWLLVASLVVVVPGMMLGISYMVGVKIWVYLFFTLVFSQMLLAWIVYATTLSNAFEVGAHCLFCIVFVMGEVWSIPSLTLPELVSQAALSAAIGAWFGRVAYDRWCRKEVAP
ncbi:MAG: hypothetical protein WCO69_02605 [Candidatus Omnitrophota bacterium]